MTQQMSIKAKKSLRPLRFQRKYTKHALGSVLVEMGETKVLCTVSLEDRVPSFLKDSGTGWLSAEYSLLPGSTHTRVRRELSKGKPSGRTSEIQRLIGRSLRAAMDFKALGERALFVDCDVLQADGGTRTASITGAMVALYDACQALKESGELDVMPIKQCIAAVSVGIIEGEVVLDLCYEQDSQAEVDLNVVMTEDEQFIEVQGTAERDPFSKAQLDEMLDASKDGINQIIASIKNCVKEPLPTS